MEASPTRALPGAHCEALNSVGAEPGGQGPPNPYHLGPPFVGSDSLSTCFIPSLHFLTCKMGTLTVPPSQPCEDEIIHDTCAWHMLSMQQAFDNIINFNRRVLAPSFFKIYFY